MERTDGYGHEKNVLHINMGATDAQLEWKRLGYLVRKKKPGREDLEAFETAYNAACGCIARGEFRQAGVLLKRSSGGFISIQTPGLENFLIQYRPL